MPIISIISQFMTNNLQTNESLLLELGHRIEQLRIRKNLTQAELAKEAGIGKRTLERIESGHSAQITSFISLLRPLGLIDNLLNLIPDQTDSPMAMLIKEKKTRYRVSKRTSKEPEKKWTWGDNT